MLKKIKNQDGFTLMEVVISIAALSVLSVFILQMFITSANANARAQNIDIASANAMSIMERFKTLNDISALEDLYPEFIIQKRDDGNYTFTERYGKDWNPSSDGMFMMEVTILRDLDALAPITVAEYEATADEPVIAPVGMLYAIIVKVVDQSPRMNLFASTNQNQEVVLADFSVDKYVKHMQ